MYWAVGICAGVAVLFLVLFIRALIKNGQLRMENKGLKEDVEIKIKQLEIASRTVATPDELLNRMREEK